jgi:uncharacterized damage-inducible protein DinB
MSATEVSPATMISKEAFLQHWLGHRKVTRKTIEKFPEQELFSFSVGGMRPFAALVKEILSIGVPGLQQMVTGEVKPMDKSLTVNSKQELLALWDEHTPLIINYFNQLEESQFQEQIKLFGMYENSVTDSLLYAVDNEIHHRAQGYVYLRALGIEPPFFWERY